jgi:Autotransporter beta-domain/Calx-beta domain
VRRTFLFPLLVFALIPFTASAVTLRARVTDSQVPEGNAGSIRMVTITYVLSFPIQSDVTGQWQTVDGTATAADGDYKKDSGVYVIPAGQTMTSFQVQFFGDDKVENDEMFTVEASNVQNASPPPPVTITILNDDVPVVNVSAATDTEGNSGMKPMLFTITMTPPAAVPVNAAYQTADVTATAGQDYQAASGTLVFAPGESVKTVSVTIIGDTTVEPDETFSLVVTPTAISSSGALPGPTVSNTGFIRNDDAANLSIVSGNGQQGQLAQPFPQPLVVALVSSLGVPVPGVTVQWKVTKGEAQLNPSSSITDAQGRASTVATPRSTGAIEIQASVPQLASVTFTFAAQTSFEQHASGPVAVPIAKVLDQICARNENTFNDVCRALSSLPDALMTPTLEHIAPQQSGAQSKVAGAVVSTVASGIASRLAALRSGTGRISVQGVSVNSNGRTIPAGALAKALFPSAFGGGAGDNASDYNGWSGFLSGDFGSGNRIGREGQLGFDLRSRGLMFGVDRQVGDNVIGLSANVMKLDSKLNDSAGSLEARGYALSIYGSREGLFGGNAPPAAGTTTHYDGVHVDGSFTVGRNGYDAEHVVDIPSMPSVAHSNNHAIVFALSGVTGVSAHRGRTDYDLSISGTWSRARIDDLTEDGDGPLILFVQGHEIESVVGNASVNVRTAWPVPFGTLLPTFRAEAVHEFTSGARLVTARFLRDRLDTSFTIPIDRPDANYGRLGAGLEIVFADGYAALIEVTQDVIRTDLHFRTWQFNLHKSF